MAVSVSDVVAGIGQAQNFANSQVGQVPSMLSNAQALLNVPIWRGSQPSPPSTAAWPRPSPIPRMTGLAVPAPLRIPADPTDPALETIKFEAPTAPGDFTDVFTPPPLPQQPAVIPQFSKAMPLFGTLTFPNEPQVFNEPAPTPARLSLPAAPSVTNHQFDAKVEDPPDIDTSDVEQALRNALSSSANDTRKGLQEVVTTIRNTLIPGYDSKVQQIQAKLKDLMDGKGIYAAGVENAIYERSKSKTNAETSRAQQDALLTAARRGFTLPSGALMSTVQQARQAGADNNATAAREIVVMQAEMQQKNMQFAVTNLALYDKLMVDASIGYLQQFIATRSQDVELAKTVVDSMMQVKRMLIEMYTARIKMYEVEANVFEAKVRASLAAVDVFKAQVEAEKVKVDVDVALVQAYEARIKAYSSEVDAYGKRVQAVATQAEIEKTKIEVFAAEVDAYGAQVKANEAAWNGYSAAMQGQKAAADAFSAKAQAYTARLSGYKALVEGESERVRALAVTNQGQLAAYEAALKANAADLQAQSVATEATTAQNRSIILAYEAETKVKLAEAELVLREKSAQVNSDLEVYKTGAEIYLKTAEIGSRANVAAGNGAIEGAKVYATLVSGAMSGVNGVLAAYAS